MMQLRFVGYENANLTTIFLKYIQNVIMYIIYKLNLFVSTTNSVYVILKCANEGRTLHSSLNFTSFPRISMQRCLFIEGLLHSSEHVRVHIFKSTLHFAPTDCVVRTD